MYKTGMPCPQSGTYVFIRHTDTISCSIDHKDEKIPMKKFELFPSAKFCRKSAYWTYLNES